ncbi:MAG: hypothetical protein KC609_01575 [Myxococcales bacterium]|nr:hypothetical protein [Myxococcales bacterium]
MRGSKLSIVLLVLVGIGCSGSSSSSNESDTTSPILHDTSGVDDQSDGVGGTDVTGPIAESFQVTWQSRDRLNPSAPLKFWRGDESATTPTDWTPNGLDCANGCDVAPSLKALVQVTSAGVDGSTLKLYGLNQLVPANGVEVSTKALSWRFDDIALYVMERANDTFELYQILFDNPGKRALVGTFAPKEGIDSYQGTFLVRANHVVLLHVSLGGAELYHLDMTNLGDGFQKLEPTIGNSQGTGSQFTEKEPFAISPDGKEVVFFSRGDNEFKIWLWSLSGGNPKNITLSESQLDACGSSSKLYYIANKAIFSPDSQQIYFSMTSQDSVSVTESCSGYLDDQFKCISNAQTKPETDILVIDRTLNPASLRNVTQNAKNDGTTNRVIDDFVVSPQGHHLVFIASPEIGGNCRSHNDREIWRISVDGSEIEMLSDDSGALPLSGTITAN